MQKLVHKTLITTATLALLITSSSIFAQSFFENAMQSNNTAAQNPNSSPQAIPRPILNQPLSPESFKNKAQSVDRETKNQMAQQTPKPSAAPAPSASGENETPAANQGSTATATPPASTPPAESSAALPPPPSNTAGTAPSAAAPSPSSSPQQNNVYTGFGGANSNTASPQSPASGNSNGAGNSGGWNIKY